MTNLPASCVIMRYAQRKITVVLLCFGQTTWSLRCYDPIQYLLFFSFLLWPGIFSLSLDRQNYTGQPKIATLYCWSDIVLREKSIYYNLQRAVADLQRGWGVPAPLMPKTPWSPPSPLPPLKILEAIDEGRGRGWGSKEEEGSPAPSAFCSWLRPCLAAMGWI